jgi:hypothetical protein
MPEQNLKTPLIENKEQTSEFLQDDFNLEDLASDAARPQLSPTQQSEILDRFFSRQIQKVTDQN